MDALVNRFFEGFTDGLQKRAASVAQEAPEAMTFAKKMVGVIRRNPITSAATAAAAGAGVMKGVDEAQEKKRSEEARRDQIRRLLMSRLSEGGYSS